MSPFERLYALATGPGDVCAKCREIAGDEMALTLLKLAFEGTTVKISPTEAANVLHMPKSTAARHIDSIGPKNSATDFSGTK